MKIHRLKLFLLAGLLISFYGYKSQTLNCEIARTGVFEMEIKDVGKVTIKRTKKHQIETTDFNKNKSKFDIVWIDDCHYELRNKKMIKGTSKYGNNPTDVLMVEIYKTEGSKLYVKTSSNYNEVKVEWEMMKIK